MKCDRCQRRTFFEPCLRCVRELPVPSRSGLSSPVDSQSPPDLCRSPAATLFASLSGISLLEPCLREKSVKSKKNVSIDHTRNCIQTYNKNKKIHVRINSTVKVIRTCIFILLSVLEGTQLVPPTCTTNMYHKYRFHENVGTKNESPTPLLNVTTSPTTITLPFNSAVFDNASPCFNFCWDRCTSDRTSTNDRSISKAFSTCVGCWLNLKKDDGKSTLLVLCES